MMMMMTMACMIVKMDDDDEDNVYDGKDDDHAGWAAGRGGTMMLMMTCMIIRLTIMIGGLQGEEDLPDEGAASQSKGKRKGALGEIDSVKAISNPALTLQACVRAVIPLPPRPRALISRMTAARPAREAWKDDSVDEPPSFNRPPSNRPGRSAKAKEVSYKEPGLNDFGFQDESEEEDTKPRKRLKKGGGSDKGKGKGKEDKDKKKSKKKGKEKDKPKKRGRGRPPVKKEVVDVDPDETDDEKPSPMDEDEEEEAELQMEGLDKGALIQDTAICEVCGRAGQLSRVLSLLDAMHAVDAQTFVCSTKSFMDTYAQLLYAAPSHSVRIDPTAGVRLGR
jgi:hypothetical protein